LSDTRQRGYAFEEGEVTTGFSSVAVAVLDHNDHPVAGIAVTYPSAELVDRSELVASVSAAAATLGARIAGR
ncbi:MAG TPA: IclR family transcriptional regulator C-terminal domain-containing protein, partial [Marmoricola sp.]|nr:IclR family transcriptional regulator C-terminal domain-containing protein [Marmoricola sp.]